jgi:hypothetical protein
MCDPERMAPVRSLPDYGKARAIAMEELRLHRGHNDIDDALRHAEWSCRMTKEIGPYTAGVGHEIDGWLHG